MVYLALGARCEEVLSFERDAVIECCDGTYKIKGKTYKLSSVICGEDRTWPVPATVAEALVQQYNLVGALQRIDDLRGVHLKADAQKFFWVNMISQNNFHERLSSANSALCNLALRFRLDPKPGGPKLHTHRFRKTVARLAALAITESPNVVMQLFGHKDISTTIGYLLSDKKIHSDIAEVARELRVLRCQDVITDIHESDINDQGYAGYGGGAMPQILAAVKREEEILKKEKKKWTSTSAYEFALQLSMNGEGYRLIRPGVFCTKPMANFTACSCGSDCVNRIEDRTMRRDVEQVIEVLVRDNLRALESQQLLQVEFYVGQLQSELSRFPDIAARWVLNSDYLRILAALEGDK